MLFIFSPLFLRFPYLNLLFFFFNFEPLSQYQRTANSHIPSLLICSWHSVELLAVNMKHYPPSSGILRGEGYGAMRAWKTIQECNLGVLQAKCLLVLAVEGTAFFLTLNSRPYRTHLLLYLLWSFRVIHWTQLIQITLSRFFLLNPQTCFSL